MRVKATTAKLAESKERRILPPPSLLLTACVLAWFYLLLIHQRNERGSLADN